MVRGPQGRGDRIQHAGGLNGFITDICFVRKERVGAIVLSNGIATRPPLDGARGDRPRCGAAARPDRAARLMPSAFRDLLGLYVTRSRR